MGTSDHAIALFCIGYGRVLGLYFDTLYFEVELRILMKCTIIYMVVMRIL